MDSFSKERALILVGLAAGFGLSTDSILRGNSRQPINTDESIYRDLECYMQIL
jgi:hypothetical protein